VVFSPSLQEFFPQAMDDPLLPPDTVPLTDRQYELMLVQQAAGISPLTVPPVGE